MSSDAHRFNRRRFAGLVGLAGAGAAATAISPVSVRIGSPETDAAPIDGDHTGHTAAAANQDSKEMTADEMDAMHEVGIKSFPAKTEGLGGQPLAPELDGDIKVFKLTCQIVQWEVSPGTRVEAWTYNGGVPGPEIRVTEGDKVRIEVTNELPESTAIHFHGLLVPNDMDGVPFITQPPIKPGQSFTYEFQVRDGNAGSHMYHSHHNAADQVTKGLLGPFIVDPKDSSTRPSFDREYTMILNDGPIGGFSLNGKSFPATQPFVAKHGQRVLFRFINEGQMIHPMHLHGLTLEVFARDGYPLPAPFKCDTLNVAPGERWDAIVVADAPGAWAFHCHILGHAEANTGMFGMVTALIVS
jgi:manganese oxidase